MKRHFRRETAIVCLSRVSKHLESISETDNCMMAVRNTEEKESGARHLFPHLGSCLYSLTLIILLVSMGLQLHFLHVSKDCLTRPRVDREVPQETSVSYLLFHRGAAVFLCDSCSISLFYVSWKVLFKPVT